MRFSRLAAGAIVFAACTAEQTPPAFDVASVRVVTSGGGRGDDVAEYQVNGPDWIDQQRYDIVAKAGGGASEAQLRSMLQTLPAERFRLEAHRQTKDGPAWVLSVGRGGPKFKESTTREKAASFRTSGGCRS